MATKSRYRYFIYSEQQMNEKNEILDKIGKRFKLGVVAVNGVRKNFTQLSIKPTLDRYFDAEIVAEGEIDTFVYTMPTSIKKRGN